MKNKVKIIITVTTLLVIMIISGTYAWFSTRVEGNGAQVVVTTGELKLIYTDTLTINEPNIEPGWKLTKTFTVENTTNEERYYKIVWKDLINTFVNTEDLTITISSTNGGGNLEKTPIQSSAVAGNYDIIKGVTIEGKAIQEYTVTFEYAYREEDQSADMGKTFSGSIEIEALESEYREVYLYAQILEDNPNVETRSDFSTIFTESNNGNTIYKASGQDGKNTYYFAGQVTNNYVEFAGYYWRIVRINEDNSVRLIYAGTSATDTAAFISTSQAYNSSYNNSAYVGYMYTASQQYGTGTNSSIKSVVDTWYQANLLPNYDGYISKTAIYCNDRGVGSGTWSATGSTFYYAAYARLEASKSPTYICSNAADRFTASETVGNGALTYPIGLIAADEVAYAGGVYGRNNSSYYIAQNASSGASWWWTMSPYYWFNYNHNNFASAFHVGGSSSTGCLGVNFVYYSYGVRPVISLKACVTTTGGDGTADNPYEVGLADGCADVENEILEENTVRVSATTNDTSMATVNAPSSVIIDSGNSHTFTLTVNSGYEYESVSGCNGTYDTNTNQLTVSNVTSSTTCLVNFKAQNPLYAQILEDNPNVETRSDFSTIFTASNNGNTIYKASGQDGLDTYYFAGAVTNNYVKFGTNSSGQDLWWRIVRINEDNSVRLIYAGTSATDTAAFISTSQVYNTEDNNNSSVYVGYMYTTSQQHGTNTNSPIKTVVDNWYVSNLNSYSEYISKTAIYCNDRTSKYDVWSENNAEYAAYTRLNLNETPTFTCSNSNDRFTASTSTGNGKLTYPIGLITADEISYAGGLYVTANTSYYIAQNASSGVDYWWTMSPTQHLIYPEISCVSASYSNLIGEIDTVGSFFAGGVRPVISLKSCVLASGGSGTASDPYKVELSEGCADVENEILEENTVRVSATTNDTSMATVNAPSSVIINSGSSHTFTFTVKDGYEYESVTGCNGTYDTSTNQLTVSNVTSSTTCQVNFKEKAPTFAETILADNPNVETRSDFSTRFTASNNGNTIYRATGQDNKTTYYFAGTVTNNYVKFANKYWRIVRINEDNSVRLIYAGTSASDTAAFINTSQAYNSNWDNSAYVGYMYTASQQYGTGTNSPIKTVVDNWYVSNLNSYSGYISKTAIYCNDRTVGSGGWSATGYTFYYAAYTRLRTNKTPTFACSNSNDRFTSSTTTGNGKLTYPIGMITADEISYAGGLWNTNNSSYYIAQNASSGASWWWTMSPYNWDSGGDARVFYVGGSSSTGYLDFDWVYYTNGVRPVISLKSCVLASGGSGTASDPYTVELPSACSSAEN